MIRFLTLAAQLVLNLRTLFKYKEIRIKYFNFKNKEVK